MPLKVNDRVNWLHGAPANAPEHNGKVTLIGNDGGICVKFDDGTEEWCDAEDLEVTNDASSS